MDSLTKLIDESTDPKSPKYVTPSIAAIAVGQNGNILWQHASGVGHEEGDPVKMDSVFWLGSQSKLMCTVAALQAVERGLVGLDDDVSNILPDLAALEVLDGGKDSNGVPTTKPRKSKISLRLLLSHQSGVGYEVAPPSIAEWSQAVGLKHGILDSDQTQKGDGNANIGVFVCVVEKLSRLHGRSLEDIYKQGIWDPLGMTKTTFNPSKYEDDLVQLYARDENGKLCPVPAPLPKEPPCEMAGHGVWSTATDYAKLLSALLNRGGSILSPESVEEMFTAQEGPNNKDLMSIVHGAAKRVLGPLVPPRYAVHHGLAGLINVDGFPARRRAGTLQWGGMTNLTWWIDRTSGIASTIFMQLLPNGDELGVDLAIRYEAAVYIAFGI
ncbi:hypothetical protein LTS17_001694 [Exophiala oligosperma]